MEIRDIPAVSMGGRQPSSDLLARGSADRMGTGAGRVTLLAGSQQLW